jgi:hypothetical protein
MTSLQILVVQIRFVAGIRTRSSLIQTLLRTPRPIGDSKDTPPRQHAESLVYPGFSFITKTAWSPIMTIAFELSPRTNFSNRRKNSIKAGPGTVIHRLRRPMGDETNSYDSAANLLTRHPRNSGGQLAEVVLERLFRSDGSTRIETLSDSCFFLVHGFSRAANSDTVKGFKRALLHR